MDALQIVVAVAAVLNVPLWLSVKYDLGKLTANLGHHEQRLNRLEAKIAN